MLALPLTVTASGAFSSASVSRESSPTGSRVTAGLLPAPEDRSADQGVRVSRSHHAARKVEVTSPKGTRTWSASALTDHGLPSAARRAYEGAAEAMAATDPSCQLPWTLLAGVGRVESDHGRYGGSVLGENGVSHPLIIGVALNGAGPVAAIRDTDNGRLDRDTVWDRAVGPMQFIPSTWAGAARDGDGDGVESPNDIDDAALAAAAYLCSGSGSVLSESAMSAAIYRYNASDEYVALVMAMEEGYRTGVFIMPVSVTAEPSPDRAGNKGRPGRGHQKDGRKPGSGATSSTKPHGTPGGKPNQDDPSGPPPSGGGGNDDGGTPTPEPKPPKKPPKKPPAPATEKKVGTLAPCGATWCLDGWTLDLGGEATLAKAAAHDYNHNEVAGETNQQELDGLSGAKVSVVVSFGTATVLEIEGLPYP